MGCCQKLFKFVVEHLICGLFERHTGTLLQKVPQMCGYLLLYCKKKFEISYSLMAKMTGIIRESAKTAYKTRLKQFFICQIVFELFPFHMWKLGTSLILKNNLRVYYAVFCALSGDPCMFSKKNTNQVLPPK